ncbi:MAG: hypothetical protein K8R69_08090 [Deltaproteobacteria bacterium]|nr:hypothetical protein [Deltaproteobacteria bacterium]
MNESDAMALLRKADSLVFSTRDFSMLAEISGAFASQMLRRLAAKGRITRLYQGLWADAERPEFNQYLAVPFLTRPHPAAVSLLSALHLHGMIEQIPQVVDVVSTALTKRVKTPLADYFVHQINPELFTGYEYYRGEGKFLIATPEKALVDCAYFASRKGRRFSALPELHLPKSFSRRKALQFATRIPNPRFQANVRERLEGWWRGTIH